MNGMTTNESNDLKNDLSVEDHSSATNMLVDAPPLNLDSLAFKVNIPPQYWVHFMAQNTGHLHRMQYAEKEKLERAGTNDPLASVAQEMMVQSLERINAHPVQLTINGRELDMTQGELRNVMSDRLDDLRKRKEQLERNGGSQEEIMAIDGLISEYEPLIDRLKTGEADAETLEKIEALAEKDPELAERLERNQRADINQALSKDTRSTSFSKSALEGSVYEETPTIRHEFGKGYDPNTPKESPEPSPQPTPGQDKLDQTFESYGL